MNTSRRKFIQNTGTFSIAGLALPAFAGNIALRDFLLNETDIKSLFYSNREDALLLTERVFEKCVLDKIRAPQPPLKNRWIQPGGPYYVGQWIWDTMFVVDLLSVLPETEELIREIFQNYWDFQDRWNETVPEFAKDMITVAIKTFPQELRQFSQIPILAWGVERVFQRNGDKKLLEQCLPQLEKWHNWYWRERDVTHTGLVTVGSYSGDVQHARWETFDYECNMDDLKLQKHPTRNRENEGAWYGNIWVTGNTSYLILGEKSLVRLAELAGDKAMAARRKPFIDKAVQAMRDYMWDEKAGTFLSVNKETMEKIPVATISSWVPLAAGVPTQKMAQRMAEVLASDSWQTPLPVPTVDRKDPRWKSNSFWRGDTWPPTSYQIASGLAAYGHTELAAVIADKTVENAIKNGLSEHYDSVTGQPLGVRDYCMAATIATMMLDGLTKKYKLELKAKK
ncbi:MGH1-like glycoside hydrolase domain-containing protein [Mariniphaga sediminis]|uniref:MGH1-like glycoside hydrolase domain-containing protein n=1 Tax=Mariniphaga sediminis TaxID=1628158 RepID=UPI0035681A39